MRYEQQTQTALDNFDVALNQLYLLIKNGKQKEAMQLMEEGSIKNRFEELQNIITISSVGNLGARGTTQTGTL